MTVALAFEMDDGSRAVQTQVEIREQDGVRSDEVAFEAYYDIVRTVEQLRRGGYRSIALQFPDSLLPDAPRVQVELQSRLDGQTERVFVLGDTSYGSCCVDEVAAQHLRADCIVHYGRTCLSAPSKIPVVYVFGNAPIDVENCVEALASRVAAMDPAKRLVLLYEPCYHHASQAVFTALQARFSERRVLYGDMLTFFDPNDPSHQAILSAEASSTNSIFIGGQPIQLQDEDPREISADDYALLYVGTESAHLTSILMRYSTVECVSYNPQMMEARKEGATVNRALMRRFFLVQKAKEAQIIGILMGTLGVSKYMDVVHGLQRMIKQSGRKSYLFVVGKVNVPKLANYAEIDAFVLVACQQNSLMDSKEYFKPIITPFELQLALSESDEWTGQFKTDFGEVLPLLDETTKELERKQDGEEDEDADKPFFSLVTGTYKSAGHSVSRATDSTPADEEDGESTTALQVKNERTDLIQYRSEAAEFLAGREYRGLEPRLGETPAHAAVKGSTGIARGYDHEQ
ncbi:hypothetical protein Poli38472_008618 [Pythium oligandrum]|uniref:2-(3-amino-3-carboxypropyl)histidine synthase subunit 2 n=1 Tax=Pythium oligandrum TaxID=41045 RepID=A0A8K1C3Y9_PYTOL|nr:hypothetical protein Poli38472_008618 [Pythium oligandrum]|eukprot:TMW55970.1 hypothetical protein Poli38472_008618 [Pythium oligandrum]